MTSIEASKSAIATASIYDDELLLVWEEIASILDVKGHSWRGLIRLPDISAHGHHLLRSLVGIRIGRTVELQVIERALVEQGFGLDLPEALESLGHPVSRRLVERRERRQATQQAYRAALEIIEKWPEQWAVAWFEDIWRAGILRTTSPENAEYFVDSIRSVLDALATNEGKSRAELAELVLGDRHALDRGTALEAALARVTAARQKHSFDEGDRIELWNVANAPFDSVSAPVLTWNLPVIKGNPFATMIHSSVGSGVPLHCSSAMLRAMNPRFKKGMKVLVVENPCVAEIAAERRFSGSIICSNGNPATAVRMLISYLQSDGVAVFYHGDFDSNGLALTRRMYISGCIPWMMTVDDYLDELEIARRNGIELPVDRRPAQPTPWDEMLAEEFNKRRLIVEEGGIVSDILSEWKAEIE